MGNEEVKKSRKRSVKTMSKNEENYKKLQAEVSRMVKYNNDMKNIAKDIKEKNKEIAKRKGAMLGGNKRNIFTDTKIVLEIMKKSIEDGVSEKSLLESTYKYNRDTKQGITKNRYYAVKRAILGLEEKTINDEKSSNVTAKE